MGTRMRMRTRTSLVWDGIDMQVGYDGPSSTPLLRSPMRVLSAFATASFQAITVAWACSTMRDASVHGIQ